MSKEITKFEDLKTIFNVSENENKSESENENENKSDDGQCYKVKQLNDWFKTIDQTKSLEEQIKILKTKDFLDEYWYVVYYHGNKKLNYKTFKTKAAHLLIDLDDQLFEKIFGYTFAALVDKLINTIDKENQIIIDDIENNRNEFFEKYKFDKSVIKQCGNLNAAKIILEINELLALDEDNNS